MRFLLAILINALILYAASAIFSGIAVEGYIDAIIVVMALTLINFLVKPILIILTLPITILTLGLFLLVINGAIILFTADILAGFYVNGWFWAIVLSLIYSLFSVALSGAEAQR